MLAMIPGPTIAWVHDDEAQHRAPESRCPVLADGPARDFSFTGLFNGAPDLAERSQKILREEFANRADASLPSTHRG